MCYRIIEKIVFYNPEEHSSIGCQDRALFDQDFYVAILINADSDGNIIPSYFRGDLPIEKLIKVRTI